MQPIKSLVGRSWSLVGIFDRSCMLFLREDEKTLSVLRLHLWQHVTILRLHINMQVMAANFEELQKFTKWMLNVGNDILFAITEEGVDPDWIKIPSHMKLLAEDYSLRGVIQIVYPNHQFHFGDAMYLCNVAFWHLKILTLMKSTM